MTDRPFENNNNAHRDQLVASTHIEIHCSRMNESALDIDGILLHFQHVASAFYVFGQFNGSEVLVIDVRIQKLCQFL